MDSMKASLRLMRSSRSISYWDLGATGMFDGILIDERGAVLRREVPVCGRMGCRNVLCGSAARARAGVAPFPRLAATARQCLVRVGCANAQFSAARPNTRLW